MMKGQRRFAPALVAFALLAAVPGRSETAELELALAGQATRHIAPDELDRLPQQHADVSFLTGHGEEHRTYDGPALWAVLDRGDALSSVPPRERARRVLVVTGRDGYTTALALAEIDPEFEGKQVLLARQPDGGLRLVVPGDHCGGRSVHDVARIKLEEIGGSSRDSH